MTGPDASKALAATARPSKYVDGPSTDGYFTAGIDMPMLDIFNELEWHGNAIEFHSKDHDEAIARRDATLAALRTQPGKPDREAVAEGIRLHCRQLGSAAVQSSDGIERIYYSGISVEALAKTICDQLSLSHEAPAQEPVADDDPSSDERYNDGIDFALRAVCDFFGVDPKDVTWDAATETVHGDVVAVVGNIMRTRYGENFDPYRFAAPASHGATREIRVVLENLVAKLNLIHQHPRFKAVWETAHFRLGPYDGPTYTEELDAAEAALAAPIRADRVQAGGDEVSPPATHTGKMAR